MTNVRPQKMDDIIGQDAAKGVCKTLLQASIMKEKKEQERKKNIEEENEKRLAQGQQPIEYVPANTSMPHCLLSGKSGGGKTTLSKAIAYERGTKLHSSNAASLKSIDDVKRIIHSVRENDIFFIDEIHNLSQRVCEFLYTVMEDYSYDESTPMGTEVRHLPYFTVLGASTMIGKLPKPLKNRFKFVAEFVDYNDEELEQIVHHVCQTYGFKLSGAAAKAIAKTCRGTPRVVVSRTEWIRDFMLADNCKRISVNRILEIIAMQGIDKHGLEKQDHRYLEIVAKHQPISLGQIASKLEIDKQTIEQDIEPWLIKKNLIEISTKGRWLS